jgi:glutathione peroxidase
MEFHDFTMRSITGEEVDFDQYRGRACLVVNVASRCGLTPQYEGLQALQDELGGDRFTVLGFPCNQFGAQEPGTDEEIREFACTRFDVDFPMFAKVEVNGEGTCDLYRFLKQARQDEEGHVDIRWNFTKFLVDGQGQVVERFGPTATPDEIGKRLREFLPSA